MANLSERSAMDHIYVLLLSVICCCPEIWGQKVQFCDLTWDFNNETVYTPGMTKLYFSKVTAGNENGFWMAYNEFCAAEHGGTHFDAPYHFNEHGWRVGDVPLERLIVQGVTVDVSREVSKVGGSFQLLPRHLEEWERKHGPFPEGSLLIVRYGWSQFWHDRTTYLGLKEGGANFPGLSKEAAEWIANSGKFYGVGVDTTSVDPGNTTQFWGHRALTAKQMYILESLKLLAPLPAKGFTVIVAPIKLGRGTGGPLRAIAVFNRVVV